jgi:hypothetical protein
MTSQTESLVARVGEDAHWWLEPDPTVPAPAPQRGLLDPRQVRALSELLLEYTAHGLTPRGLTEVFRLYALSSELGDGLARFEPTPGNFLNAGDAFALPAIDEDGDGPYYDFLDAVIAARVRRLNATHQYARPCTVDDLREELDALDQDRYFSAETIHPFDEITEILQWHPAAWDEE